MLGTLETGESETTARGLWYFGGGCGVVDENVSLSPDNTSEMREALNDPPSARGERSLVDALDTAVNGLADTPVTLPEGDVRTVRHIVVYTDGADECDGDLTRVTTSLDQSGIDVGFWLIGMDLAATEQEQLDQVAQSLPGVGDGPAKLTVVRNDEELEDATAETVSTTTTTAPASTDTDTSDSTTTTDTSDSSSTTTDTSDTTTTEITTTTSDTTTSDSSDTRDTGDTGDNTVADAHPTRRWLRTSPFRSEMLRLG